MKVSKQDQKLLAIWAADCAEHVLPYFEKKYPEDNRPKEAIETLQAWIDTGEFKMAVIRGSSLAAHAAARKAKKDSAAQFAARAAGQAVATAHVPSHSIGAAWYGIKAVNAAGADTDKEREWQYQRLPKHLRPFILQLSKKRPALAKVLRYPAV